MSKLSFRARALDANKPVAVYRGDDIPDQLEFGAANRAIVEMPTGMEKEEETEHHLQRALNAQQIYGTSEVLFIPVPEMDVVGERYNKLYGSRVATGYGFRPPKQYIHVQPPGVEHEIPEYDMDSEDEQWLNKQIKSLKMEVTPIKFENMLDRLEKGSGQMVVTLREAKALLKEDDDLTIAVYDYWLNKRLKLQHALIPQVKSEKRDGSTTSNPYVAFRRRTEKMQTRKNRKNDESSYEKMLKLKKDLNKAILLLEMLKRREKSKKELLKLTVEVYEQRYRSRDWDGRLVTEAKELAKRFAPTSYAIVPQHYPAGNRDWDQLMQEDSRTRRKREYKKRKHKQTSVAAERRPLSHSNLIVQQPPFYTGSSANLVPHDGGAYSSVDEDVLASGASGSDVEVDNDPDGVYAFKRKADCVYQASRLDGLGDWPWCSRSEGGLADEKYRFTLTSLHTGPGLPSRCIGYARRRVGRGGRVLLDRVTTPWDDKLMRLDLSQTSPAEMATIPENDASDGLSTEDTLSVYLKHIRTNAIPTYQQRLSPLSSALSRCRTYPNLHGSSFSLPFQQSRFRSDLPKLSLEDGLRIPSTDDCFQANILTSTATTIKQEPSPTLPDVPDNGDCRTGADSLGLSTLPADSILQLNYPLAAAVEQSNRPLLSSSSSLSYSTTAASQRLTPLTVGTGSATVATTSGKLIAVSQQRPVVRITTTSGGGDAGGFTSMMDVPSSTIQTSFIATTTAMPSRSSNLQMFGKNGATLSHAGRTAVAMRSVASSADGTARPQIVARMPTVAAVNSISNVQHSRTLISGQQQIALNLPSTGSNAMTRFVHNNDNTTLSVMTLPQSAGLAITSSNFATVAMSRGIVQTNSAAATIAVSSAAALTFARNVATFTRPATLLNLNVPGGTNMVARANIGMTGSLSRTLTATTSVGGGGTSSAVTSQAIIKLGNSLAARNNTLVRDTRDERGNGVSGAASNEQVVAMEVT